MIKPLTSGSKAQAILSSQGSTQLLSVEHRKETCMFSLWIGCLFTNIALRMGRTQPRRTDANMWLISGVLCDNTCRRLKTSSKGQQRYFVTGLWSQQMLNRRKSPSLWKKSFQELFFTSFYRWTQIQAHLHVNGKDMTANRQMVSPVLRYFFPQSPEPMLLNFK